MLQPLLALSTLAVVAAWVSYCFIRSDSKTLKGAALTVALVVLATAGWLFAAVFPFAFVTMWLVCSPSPKRLKRAVLTIALVVLAGTGWLTYEFFHPGEPNFSGGQPPTACTVATAQQDCRKLKCVNPWNVWYCDHEGVPACYEGRCVCEYGCL